MRVLQWIFPFVSTQGGRENFVLNLAQDLIATGDEVLVIGLDPAAESITPTSIEHDEFPVVTVGLASMLSGRQGVMPQLLAALEQTVIGFRPDVIHNHNPEGPDLLLLRALAKELRVPIVTTVHGPLLTPAASAQGKIRLMSELSSRIITISETSRAETIRNYPELQERLALVVNGAPESPAANLKPAYPNRIFASGRLSPEKGFAQLIAAVAMLRQVIPEVELVLAGAGPDSRILPKFAEALGVADRVRFTGWLSRAATRVALSEASVVVVPSVWSEPFGLVAVEAMLAGKPVIASRRGELTEIVRDGETGLLFDSGDVIDLAAKLRLLLEDQSRAAALGDAGRKRALEHYSQRRCTLQYRNHYLGVQQLKSNFSAAELGSIGGAGNWRVYPQDLGVVLQDANRVSDILTFKRASRVPAIFKLSHDDATPLPADLTAGAAVFRVSMIAGQPYQNEFPLPTLITGEEFEHWQPAPHTERAAIGFVGQAQHELYHKAISQRGEEEVHQVGYELIESTNSLLRTPVNIGLLLRKRALATLSQSELVESNFLVRDSYHFRGAAAGNPASTRSDFLASLHDHAYSLCVRGAGNYSIRLYETLAAGRIPIILNTALVLPLSNQIDWRSLGVWVESDQLANIDQVVADFHASMTPVELRERQREIRDTWLRYLAPQTFWKHALAEIQLEGKP